MNWISFLRYSKYLLINFIVFLCIWIPIETVYYFQNPLNKSSNRISCNYDWVLYNYCPNITEVKINTPDDGSEIIFTYTNEIGQRVSKKGAQANSAAEHIFVGDSFIQAEEMAYEKTFYGQLEKSLSVTAIGYSSWNIIEYNEAIKKLAYRNRHYHVFLMPNDINPAYWRSVYNEVRSGAKRKRDNTVPSSIIATIKKGYSNSLIKKFPNLSSKPKNLNLEIINSDEFASHAVNDCAPLNRLKSKFHTTMAFDYLVYSKSEHCWSNTHKEAANIALIEFAKLVATVDGLDSNLTVYMIPPGWSFTNQNTNGRKNNAHYAFGDNSRFTTEPLLKFFKDSFASTNFVSLEQILNEWIEKCTGCADNFYFPDDGHWTPHTHKLLSQYFLSELKKL